MTWTVHDTEESILKAEEKSAAKNVKWCEKEDYCELAANLADKSIDISQPLTRLIFGSMVAYFLDIFSWNQNLLPIWPFLNTFKSQRFPAM
jgi:hypothetical protein